MKKGVKITILSVTILALLTPGAYFGVNAIIKHNKIANGLNTFVTKFDNAESYFVKNIDVTYEDTNLSHTFTANLSDTNIVFNSDHTGYDIDADITISYDYETIYEGHLAIIGDYLYFKTSQSVLTSDNVKFTKDSLKNAVSAANLSTLVGENVLNLKFDIDAINKIKSNLKEVKTKDEHTFNYSYTLENFDSTILLTSDEDYNLLNIRTSTPLESDGVYLSFNATNIKETKNVVINVSEEDFKTLDPLFNGAEEMFKKFDKTTGLGASFFIGDKATSTPLKIYIGTVPFISFYGEFNIHNKLDKNGFMYHFIGDIVIDRDDEDIITTSLDLVIENDTIYVSTLEILNGSIKFETIEKIFEINKEEFSRTIDSVFYTLFDGICINKKIDENYKVLEKFEINDNNIDLTITAPISKETDTNKSISVGISYEDKNFKSLNIADFSINDYSLKNFLIQFNENLEQRPTIDTSKYYAIDDYVENFFNFI